MLSASGPLIGAFNVKRDGILNDSNVEFFENSAMASDSTNSGLGDCNPAGIAGLREPLRCIPNSVMNLDLDLRESSRGSSILSRPILTIWGDLRSTIPGALARSKFQVADRVGYTKGRELLIRIVSMLVKMAQKKY